MDKGGLRNLTVEQLAKGMQSQPGNEIAGLEGRANLLIRLGDALEKADYFGDDGRPGCMIGMLKSYNMCDFSLRFTREKKGTKKEKEETSKSK